MVQAAHLYQGNGAPLVFAVQDEVAIRQAYLSICLVCPRTGSGGRDAWACRVRDIRDRTPWSVTSLVSCSHMALAKSLA